MVLIYQQVARQRPLRRASRRRAGSHQVTCWRGPFSLLASLLQWGWSAAPTR
jgi:hypothetical protein